MAQNRPHQPLMNGYATGEPCLCASLAVAGEVTGNCSTVARCPLHNCVNSTAFPSGNSHRIAWESTITCQTRAGRPAGPATDTFKGGDPGRYEKTRRERREARHRQNTAQLGHWQIRRRQWLGSASEPLPSRGGGCNPRALKMLIHLEGAHASYVSIFGGIRAPSVDVRLHCSDVAVPGQTAIGTRACSEVRTSVL